MKEEHLSLFIIAMLFFSLSGMAQSKLSPWLKVCNDVNNYYLGCPIRCTEKQMQKNTL